MHGNAVSRTSVRASQKANSATLPPLSRLLPTATYFLTRDLRQMGDIKRMSDREPFVKGFGWYCETWGKYSLSLIESEEKALGGVRWDLEP